MKTNQREIVITPRAVDGGKLRSVLREWGYEESEINRVLTTGINQLVTKRLEHEEQAGARSFSLQLTPSDGAGKFVEISSVIKIAFAC